MDLITKLQNMSQPRILPLKSGHDKTLSDFWDNFVAPMLPNPRIVKQWYELLLRYINDDDAVFAIRNFGSVSNKDDYISLRRGFYNTTDNGYSLFYTDNFFTAYFAKMAIDSYIPDYYEFKELMLSRQFPARFGPYDSKYEQPKAAYDITGKNGKDPMFVSNGYKIAHLFDVGTALFMNGRNFGIKEICDKYCPRGDYGDWKKDTDKYGDFYVRRLGKLDDTARKFFMAHFLRMTCPLNYVLTPKQNLHSTPVAKDIAEYSNFQRYAMKKFYEIYGDTYKDFVSNIMSNVNIDNLDVPDEDIDIEYGPQLNNKTMPKPTPAPRPTTTASTRNTLIAKESSLSKPSVNHMIALCKLSGYSTFPMTRYASLNASKDVYWLNPTEKDIRTGFTLFCYDTKNRLAHVFNIPGNDLDIKKLKTRNSVSGIKFNVEIRYNDKTFTDEKSGIRFDKYLVVTLKY